MLKKSIYAAHIKHLTDARYFAAYQVDYMSFPLDQGLNPQTFAAMVEWVEGPQVTMAFTSTPLQDILQLTKDMEITTVQLPIQFYQDWSTQAWNDTRLVLEVDLAFIDTSAVIKHPNVDAVLLKAQRKLDKSVVQPYLDQGVKVYLDLNHQDFDSLMALYEYQEAVGFVLEGAEEEKVGYKSFEEIDEIMEALMD